MLSITAIPGIWSICGETGAYYHDPGDGCYAICHMSYFLLGCCIANGPLLESRQTVSPYVIFFISPRTAAWSCAAESVCGSVTSVLTALSHEYYDTHPDWRLIIGGISAIMGLFSAICYATVLPWILHTRTRHCWRWIRSQQQDQWADYTKRHGQLRCIPRRSCKVEDMTSRSSQHNLHYMLHVSETRASCCPELKIEISKKKHMNNKEYLAAA